MIKWTYEACYEEAKKYKSRGEFSDKSPSAWAKAKKKGWIEDYNWFIEREKPRGYWNYEHCYELAKQCVSKSDFKKHNQTAYDNARINGWIDEYTWFRSGFYIYHETGIKWTYENTKEESRKYTSRQEFHDNCVGGYTRALKQGWLDDFTWLKPKLIKEAKSHGSIYWIYGYFDFGNKVCYIGLSRDKARHWRHTQKDSKGKYDSAMSYFNNKYGYLPEPTIIEENLTAEEAQNKEAYYVALFKDKGYIILNIMKTGSLGSAIIKWDENSCFEEAKKYTTLSDFYTNSECAYRNAKENDWIDSYTWLKRNYVKRGFWQNYDNCLEEAKKYKTRKQFQIGNNSAYTSAWKHGWLNEFFPKSK